MKPKKTWKNARTKLLAEAFLKLKTVEESEKFMRDLMTVQEIEVLSQRFYAAKMLDQKETYSMIEAKTSMSSATIARIKNWLDYGEGGYRLILDRMKKEKVKK
jgi:TrpR-related protein YerC/YecD